MRRCIGLVASLTLFGGVAQAQESDVALVSRGEQGVAAADAFASFVELPAERRYAEVPDPPPDDVALLVIIDTDTPLIRVWRRSDGAVLERRFDAPEEDGYALALVATELLEVARTGGDPETVGATLDAAESTTEPRVPDAEPAQETVAPPADVAPPPGELAFTAGLSAEGWLSTDAGSPWLVQPALFVELVATPSGERFVIGGGLIASGGGVFVTDGQARDIEGHYQRYDLGVRLSVGGDLGPARTRLMGHLRGGAAAVLGRGTVEASGERAEAVRAGWFAGVSAEARQPLVEGLEVTLELGLDVLPAPVAFVAFGEPLLVESTVRLAARLGLAWRFE